MVISKFDGELYRKARPFYPVEIFGPLRSMIGPLCGRGSLQILDLGAGTGFSAASFAKLYPQVDFTLLDPDGGMLNEAKKQLPDARLISSVSHEIPSEESAFDGVLIGSAWHWMKKTETVSEINRVLRLGGFVYVFEYQIPKATHSAELNEWVRRQFNLFWKAPLQTPRGSLYEITEALRTHSELSQKVEAEVTIEQTFSAAEFASFLFSQSRFLHFEHSLDLNQRDIYRRKVASELESYWQNQPVLTFLYSFHGFSFQKRP